jgi:beta-1,4-N-acetylglucosaminyltransferase
MIFVTVGMHYQGFDRLIRKMDEIASKIEEEVIMQIGSTKYAPKNAKFFNFVENEFTILAYFKSARVVVSHAGAGTILYALSLGKPVIVVPRLKKFKEHVDDQQLELADVLSEKGTAIAVKEIEDIEQALKNINQLVLASHKKDMNLLLYLKEFIRCVDK